jgi:hypothetical protein
MSFGRRIIAPSFHDPERRVQGADRRAAPRATGRWRKDAQLSALTYLGGFLFMTVFLS